MFKRHRGSTLLAAVMAGGLILGLPAASGARVPAVAAADSIPVLRTFDYVIPGDGVAMAGAVHQVTRIQGGTLVVWSLGSRSKATTLLKSVRIGGDFNDGVSSVGPYLAKLADPASKTVLKPLVDALNCLCSDFQSRSGGFQPGKLLVMYAVFPEIPATSTTIDLDPTGFGSFVAGLPVSSDKPLAPAAKDGIPELGQGWPTYPSADTVTKAIAQDKPPAVWDMALHSGRADNSARIDDGKHQTTVDLAADVLFAFDSADLTAQATAGLALAADQVKAGKAKTVTVTGHTDSTGADDYNLTLSQRRADAVRTALVPLLPGVTITANGKGEAEPVASNDTAEGQALNRRVSIVFEAGK